LEFDLLVIVPAVARGLQADLLKPLSYVFRRPLGPRLPRPAPLHLFRRKLDCHIANGVCAYKRNDLLFDRRERRTILFGLLSENPRGHRRRRNRRAQQSGGYRNAERPSYCESLSPLFSHSSHSNSSPRPHATSPAPSNLQAS